MWCDVVWCDVVWCDVLFRLTYTAGVFLVVAGTEHVRGDAPRGGAAVAAVAPGVGPDLHVNLHQICWLRPGLAQGPPAGHGDLTVDVFIGSLGQTDGLDVGGEPHVVLHGQDGHVVPLKTILKCISLI